MADVVKIVVKLFFRWVWNWDQFLTICLRDIVIYVYFDSFTWFYMSILVDA